VVIANSVAYEGVDLQVRTCTIHHLDLPWTPADLEQRNGRAVRQGNTLGTVHIYYYFADGSTDGYRFSLIDGKAGWLGELIKSQVRDTNNPAAQQQLTPEDILLMISRNKEKTRALLEDKKKRQAEEARARVAKEAARLLRQAAGRFRDARATTDAEKAARLRDEGEQRLADLEQVNPDAWPWARGCTRSATSTRSSPRTAARRCTRACASSGPAPVRPISSSSSSSARSSARRRRADRTARRGLAELAARQLRPAR
jgi:superfamily II DNA/RNA helicase